ncbi:MAG: PQQ-dependent sugar dehydrogenase, partial [Candidatus Thiodiazotropha sp.]
MSQSPQKLSVIKMNSQFYVIFPIGVLVIVYFHSVHSQGLCLDGKTPFKSEVGSSFCSMYENYGCCGENENADLSIKFTRLANSVPSHLWRNCSSYAKTFLCQLCSPWAAFQHEAVTDEAFESIPRKFPGLCKDFCYKFYDECKDLVKYYIEVVEDKPTPTKDSQKLLAAAEESVDAFCKMVELQDNKYCYPDLINMTNVKTGFLKKPDSGTMPHSVNRMQKTDFLKEPNSGTISHLVTRMQMNAGPVNRPQQVPKTHFIQNSFIERRLFSRPENKARVKKRAADDVNCLCVEKIASKLRMPVFLRNANDGSNRLFIGEQIGVIHIYYPDGTQVKEPFLDITSRVKKMTSIEQGMTGMAFHPNFKSNGYFYVYFSTPKDKSKVNHYSNVGEFKVSSKDINKADPDYFRLVFQIPQPKGVHNGGEVGFYT